MSFPNLNLNKKMNRPTLTLKVTERDKKLLAVFGVLLLILLSYYSLYKPLTAKTETLKNEQTKIEAQVTALQSALKNEAQIHQNYTTVLDKVNESSGPFFPKVYPYKDRYILLLEKVVTASGSTASQIGFSDPEVSGVLQPKQDKTFILPDYLIKDLAEKINRANASGNVQNAPTEEAQPADAKATKSAGKTLPADAVLRLPVNLTVQGSYAQIRAVISNLENLKRTIAIEKISIGIEKDASLKADITLSFYAVEKVDNSVDSFNQWTLQGSYGKADLFK